MNNKPLLSIVTATLGKFSDYWLENLLNVEGAVQFVFIYPPQVKIKLIDDPRVTVIVSPYKGEWLQRYVGFLNATGEYVLALDDDDYVHPQVCELISKYFNIFPESWIIRLQKLNIDINDEPRIKQPWAEIPDIDKLQVCKKTPENPFPYENGNFQGLLEVPIAPLQKNFDFRYLIWPFLTRRDNEGYHFENFNNIVWRNDLIQQGLPELSRATKVLGAVTWIPAIGLDRLAGLFIQAQFFQPDAIIGHWMPKPEQIRYIDKDPALKPPRFHIFSDILLIKVFPQYGYFWNLAFNKLYGVPRTLAKLLKLKLIKKAQQ
ncbi:glycosyl transferase family A [Nodularia spumigena CENA596]|uniref:Glycosyl transferase family A n=1 Tax=Nodularia spumigena CENA596 TaxID=1819295 RepID=A0A166J9A1_NODSP|nr:glycosyltransferase family A protein [Nodularia spumigena]KZL49397.1 glycosyl transferase family A [Nodularia spumigena CENA596]